MINKNKIKLDYSKDSLFDPMGLRRLRDSYLKPSEKSPQDRFSYVARSFGSNPEHAQRLYNYLSNQWLSAATPILSYGVSKRGLPISCYLSYISDSAESLVDTLGEVSWLSMLGGGVGIGLGIRSEDDKSVGVMPHLKTYEAVSLAYRQGKTRRGSFAGYLGINHPNITQFIDMRKPTGDANQRCMELHHGVNITDDFMEIVEKCMIDSNYDDSWPLIDPHTQKVREVVSAKGLWERIIETRMRTGEPYLHFIDRSNEFLPQFQKDLGLTVKQSNICTEITEATDAERTAVCCLSSLNLEHWDEWKDNYQFYRDVAEMLDNATEVFIRKAPKEVSRAIYSASRERSIGIGVLGFHALLQKKRIPFESAMATSINRQIFAKYEDHIQKANRELAGERGECPDAVGHGWRFTHTRAIAPNASSSILMNNTSASVEPFRANAYRQDTLSGSFLYKNRFLDEIIKAWGLPDKAYNELWSSIVTSAGSIQHLDIFDQYTKDIFKTATELDQQWIIEHAAVRQKHVDQAQSINLFFSADVDINYLHRVHFDAWKKGLKTLYYCRSNKLFQGESMNNKIERVKMSSSTEETCLSCEG